MKASKLFLVLLLSLAAVKFVSAADIKAKTIGIPGNIKIGVPFEINLIDYYRSNILIDTFGISGEKNVHAVSVPGLIEYSINFSSGGEYQLFADYRCQQDASFNLSVDGHVVSEPFFTPTELFQKHEIARFKVAPGKHYIRISAKYVESTIPQIKSIHITKLNNKYEKSVSTEKIVGQRDKLPEDYLLSFSRKIHLDFHTGGFIKDIAKDFNPDSFAISLKNSYVNSVVLFAKCHHGYSYNNTKIGTRHPGLDFDLLKAQIDACHKYGITTMVYFSVAVDELWATTEDNQQQAFGSDRRGHFYRVDVDTEKPYVSDYLWPMIDEVVKNYDLDGFWFDFPGNDNFVDQTVKRIRDIKPGIIVAYNQQWNKSRAELSKLDLLEIESWMQKLPLYHVPYLARYARGAVPLTGISIRFLNMWGDMGALVDEQKMMFDAATLLANGCLVTVGDHLHPYGKLEPAIYQRIKSVMEYAEKVEPYVYKAQSIPYIALFKHVDDDDQSHTTTESVAAILLDAGIHFDVIDATSDIKDYKAIVIDDAAAIGKDYLAKLNQYVQSGGNLIVSGQPSTEFAKLMGIQVYSDIKNEPAYFNIQNKYFPSLTSFNYYSFENMVVVKPVENTEILAPLTWPLNHGTIHASGHRQSPACDQPSGYAAITKRELGKGNILFTAASLPVIYAEHGFSDMKKIFEDLIYRVIPESQRLIEVESSAPVEVSLTRQGDRIIIHFVHCSQGRRSNALTDLDNYTHREPIIDGTSMLTNVNVYLNKELYTGGKIYSLLDNKVIKTLDNGDGRIRIQLPDFSLSQVLIIE